MIAYNRQDLGVILKAAREKAELTQMDVSAKLNYSSPQFISNIERGISVAPLVLLSKLIKIYKMKPEPLMDVIMEGQKHALAQIFSLKGKKGSARA